MVLIGWLLVRQRQSVTSLELTPTPNVLLVSIDTLRADHLGAYGARIETPHIDRLAAKGVVFEKALTPVPITLPAHASLLTGFYPIAHGVRDNGTFRLHDDYETLLRSFRKPGTGRGRSSVPSRSILVSDSIKDSRSMTITMVTRGISKTSLFLNVLQMTY